jgi:hypothetical protein
MHAVWRLLLDAEFMHAYVHGIVIECFDGVLRRFFPRIFTYSADYPEKYVLKFYVFLKPDLIAIRILLATIRNQGLCPCPRCETPKQQLPEMGTIPDKNRRTKLQRVDNDDTRDWIARAREFIYTLGRTVKSSAVERVLEAKSYVPTMVCPIMFLFPFIHPLYSSLLSRRDCCPSDLICSIYLSSICCMSLN